MIGMASSTSCPLCADALTGDVLECAGCNVAHHAGCARSFGHCPTFGCFGATFSAASRPGWRAHPRAVAAVLVLLIPAAQGLGFIAASLSHLQADPAPAASMLALGLALVAGNLAALGRLASRAG